MYYFSALTPLFVCWQQQYLTWRSPTQTIQKRSLPYDWPN